MEQAQDEGFSLVETLVAIVLVTIALFALTAELVAYIHHQSNEKSRTTAVRLMTSSIESARRLTLPTLLAAPTGTPTTVMIGGRTYTTTTQVQTCSLSDLLGACTTPSNPVQNDVRVKVTISWMDGTSVRTVSSGTSVANTATTNYTPTGTGTLSTLVGGVADTATTVTVNAFTASPTTTTVSTSGVPTSAITLSLNTVGLTAGTTSIPVTWTDDAGSHQWPLTGGPNAWTATIPASSFSKAVTSGTSTITFAATVPGSRALVTAPLTLTPVVTLPSCTVNPAVVGLAVLSRKTAAAETLSCTSTGLAATDAVTVSYPSGSGTATGALTSTNGTSWTMTLPAGTPMAAGVALSETFTFNAVRADGVSASKAVTAVMA